VSEANGVTDPVDIVHAMWRDIDLNDGRKAHEWYLPDGTLTFDQRTSHGQDEIAATYEKRRSGTARVARHVAANISREVVDDTTVRVYSIVVLYAGNGAVPLPNVNPAMVGDVFDVFVREGGTWLLQSRTITTIFIAPETVLGVPTK
jgi:hypothetical protein